MRPFHKPSSAPILKLSVVCQVKRGFPNSFNDAPVQFK